MTDDAAESTLLNPGERYRDDATFDLTKKLCWVILEDEESRQVKTTGTWWDPGSSTSEELREIAVTYYGAPDAATYLAEYAENEPGYRYLDYNGFYQRYPVNQIPFLREWRPFVARSAHEFDWTMSAHSLRDLSENERWTVERQMYGLIAAPWFVMKILAATSPTVMVSGNFQWKIFQGDAEAVLAGLCHECEDLATFARRFAHKANLELFRGALVSGKVHETDRDVTPWGLGEVVTKVVVSLGNTPTAEKITAFHNRNREEYLRVLEFYDQEVGARERPHSHD